MYTCSIISSLGSVLCLYAVARKVEIPKTGSIRYLSGRIYLARVLSFFLFVSSTAALVPKIGLASSLIGATILWVLVASAVLLIAPAGRVKGKHLLLGSLLVLMLEFSLNYIN